MTVFIRRENSKLSTHVHFCSKGVFILQRNHIQSDLALKPEGDPKQSIANVPTLNFRNLMQCSPSARFEDGSVFFYIFLSRKVVMYTTVTNKFKPH